LISYDRVLAKCFWGPEKVLEFFVTKRVGTLTDALPRHRIPNRKLNSSTNYLLFGLIECGWKSVAFEMVKFQVVVENEYRSQVTTDQ